MTLPELLNTSFRALMANKVRAFLTTLGIIIGIMSVITLLNIGTSAQNAIIGTVNSLGSNLISVIPGRVSNNSPIPLDLSAKLTLSDFKGLQAAKPNYYTEVSGLTSKDFSVQNEGATMRITLAGIIGNHWLVRDIHLQAGRELNEQDNQTFSRVAVIGTNVAANLFPNQNPIGQELRVNKVKFTIIGVNESKGATGFSSPDDYIYIPMTTYQKVISGDDSIRIFYVKARNEESVAFAQSEIETNLRRLHGLTEDQESDFTIRNAGELLSILGQITGVFTAFLGAIGAISLVVGGIGIMNIMFVTVRERTREIGLRKSLGATNRDILLQFLTEAVAITLIGGIVGTFLGVTLSYLIAIVAGLEPVISLGSIFLSVGVSAAIGLVFGIYPARTASLLSPIDALRFE